MFLVTGVHILGVDIVVAFFSGTLKSLNLKKYKYNKEY